MDTSEDVYFPNLLDQGHEVICAVRDKMRLGLDAETLSLITIWEVDFLEEVDFENCPTNIDIAYFLIHSMSSSTENFDANGSANCSELSINILSYEDQTSHLFKWNCQ